LPFPEQGSTWGEEKGRYVTESFIEKIQAEWGGRQPQVQMYKVGKEREKKHNNNRRRRKRIAV